MSRKNSRRRFIRSLGLGAAAAALSRPARAAGRRDPRPNILFAIADDWSWPHAGVGGDPVVKTPAFDRIAREGVLFSNAFVSAPSCTPSRGAILTGQHHWRLEEGGNLWSTLRAKFEVYPDILEKAGYHVGCTRKGWGPGNFKDGGRKRNPAGPSFRNFADFLKRRPDGKPFCFWFGSHDPHRGYKMRSGVSSGMRPGDVRVPACLPASNQVRSDICDYYWEVQRYDRDVGGMLAALGKSGELGHTLVVMTSDNGMPFPRCKSNLYDMGTHMPLAVRWGEKVTPRRVVKDFVSFTDFAPTFLAAAGLRAPAAMTGRSFLEVLTSGKSGQVDPGRDRVYVGKERHTCAQKGTTEGYPMRAVRTAELLYIRNFKPHLWPAGSPEIYRDIDGAPTKSYMMKNRDEADVKRLFELGFGKRPAEELYDLAKDPDQLVNVAARREYAAAKKKLA
ncbi:MAG: sulfatase family protein, partial [Planctomycetota bacterium]